MDLQDLWFWVICLLWTGYFVLEGFDFGVGMLLPVLGRTEDDKRTLFASIGPVWDANEVWLLVAGGATFAAFPGWYATMFSGFYLALLLILVLLILRVISFEWRTKAEHAGWRRFWTWMNTIGSVGAPAIWGIAFANLLQGVPIDSSQNFTGNFGDLFTPYTVFAGIAIALVFAFHGAVFLTLRTVGDLLERARGASRTLGPIALVAGGAFLVWTVIVGSNENDKGAFPGAVIVALAAVALIGAIVAVRTRRDRLAFGLTAGAILLTVVTIFIELFPRVMVSSTDFANSLTVDNASSAHYTLTVITVVAAVLVPVILLYQGWSYHVFRARVGLVEPATSPVDLLARKSPPPTPSADPDA